jgi:predicted Zn-dependent peptidase
MQQIKINSTPVILKNTDFQSIFINVMFPFEDEIDNLAKSQLLPSMLNYMDKAYPSEELFQTEKKKLYILSTYCSKNIIGTTGCFSFKLTIPDVKSLGKNMLEEQIKFFSEMIYNPLIIDNGFNKFELNREISNLHMALNNALKNVRPYHSIRLCEEIDDVGILSRDIIRHQELIDLVTPENLYNYYLDIIHKNKPIIYVMGNVDEEEINELCEKYLIKNKEMEKVVDCNFYSYLVPRDKTHEVLEDSNFKDSVVSLVYKVKDMKKTDEVLLNTVRDLLSSLSSRILSKKLRDENDLIYSSRVKSYPHYGALEITAFINKNHYLEVRSKIQEVMSELKVQANINDFLENIKERKRINLLRKLDDKYLIFDDFIFSTLGIDITLDEYYEIMKNITADDICLFLDRLQLDTVYFLKEGEIDE